jgi:hypothetical protein
MGNLGTPISGGLFHQSSVGSVTGVVLDDGRSVVIKGINTSVRANSLLRFWVYGRTWRNDVFLRLKRLRDLFRLVEV